MVELDEVLHLLLEDGRDQLLRLAVEPHVHLLEHRVDDRDELRTWSTRVGRGGREAVIQR